MNMILDSMLSGTLFQPVMT